MKKLISYVLMCAVLAGFYIPASAEETAWKEFYVSVDGNDSNPGTADAPFKTIQAAKDAVRKVNSEMQGDIVVNIGKGYYYLDEMLDFRNEDSGFNGHRVIYRGEGDKEAVISGGYQLDGFVKSEYEGIYVADVDDEAILQISVNGKRRYVAKAANQIVGVRKPEKYMTEEYQESNPSDYTRDEYNYNDPKTDFLYDGMYIAKKDFAQYDNIGDVFCSWNEAWVTSMMPVEEVIDDPDRADVWAVRMDPGLWNWAVTTRNTVSMNHMYPDPAQEFTVLNAFELLDEPGEFYYNRTTNKLYYMPEADEDMNTATVIVPRLETLIYFDGNDISDKVKNITFENLRLSDSQWDYINGFYGQQATSIGGDGFSATAPRAIYAERADGIEILDNVINNIGGSAIDFYNAVTNSKIEGNVIYDVGESAILTGSKGHSDHALGSYVEGVRTAPMGNLIQDGLSDPVPKEAKDMPMDLVSDTTTKFHYSYFGLSIGGVSGSENPIKYPGDPGADDRDDTKYGTIHISWMTEDYEHGTEAWHDNYSKTKGEKPYLMFEFMRPYSIDEVSLCFTDDVTAEEKTNYEILVSNDKTFAEGTYKTVAVEEGRAPETVNHYMYDDDTKYRFVMIRKRSVGDFAVSRVWIATRDRKPYQKNQRCNHITIENNAIERIGVDASRSIGIIVTHGEDFSIKHNDVRDVGYSGMSIGFSWVLSVNTCYKMDVAYNYVYDTCQTMPDGGGIYVLGPQPDSYYHHNHIEKANLANQGFYTDNGSRFELIEQNYIENTVRNLSPYNVSVTDCGNGVLDGGGIAENTFQDNYGTHTYSNDAAKDYNDFEEVIQTTVGLPPKEAYDTYKNAGLEDEYKHLRNYIPKARDNLYTAYDYWYASRIGPDRNGRKDIEKQANASELSYTLNNARFGNGLGMYPEEYRAKLQDAIDYLTGGSNSDLEMQLTYADEFQQELKENLNRYSYEETLALCEKVLEEAKGEKAIDYPAGAAEELEKAIEKVKKMKQSTPEQEYDALIALEDAYNVMNEKRYSSEIVRATMPGALFSEVNSEESTITITVKTGYSLTTDALEIEAENQKAISRTLTGTYDLEKGVLIPVIHRGTGKYKIWRVKAEYQKAEGSSVIGKDTEWLQNTIEDGFIRNGQGFKNLSGSRYAYMAADSAGETETKLVFKPLEPNGSKSFNVILGANFAERFDYRDNRADYNRCELEFEDDKVRFIKVSEGKRTQMDITDSGIKWNEKNELTSEVKEINENTHFRVKLNGKLIFDQVIQKCSYGRYMGFFTPDATIRLY